MMEQPAQVPPRRPYERPELTVIDFAADEVMAVGCKTASGGPSRKPGAGCRLTNCFQAGS
jgi:hypothetical protein